jgi:hypothetical protein
MDITFSCPGCGVSLEVESEASGQQFDCPSCSRPVTVPAAPPAGAASAGSQSSPRPPTGPAPVLKADKRYAVPVTQKPVESLIQKPNKSLEAVAKGQKPGLRVKTIRHSDCKEVGKDKFDDVVSDFFNDIGDANVVSITPINYSCVDVATQKLITDFGVMVVYRG